MVDCIGMHRLLLFNNSNDLALASGMGEYIPPASVVRMERDLAALPYWWAEDGDAVLLENVEMVECAQAFFASMGRNVLFTCDGEGYTALCKRTGCLFVPLPWGWSKAAVYRFMRFGVPRDLMPDDDSLQRIRLLSSKEFAVAHLHRLLAAAAVDMPSVTLLGDEMRYISSLDGFEISKRTILKAPWSSSGRGVFFADNINAPSIREKLSGFIKRQGGFVADMMYDKRFDFALEFFVTDADVCFLGYSVFVAGENGFYGYNIVASQPVLRRMIVESGCDDALLDWLIDASCVAFKEALCGRYSGVAGVDMLVALCDDELRVHPCVEVNLRMNVGVLAARVFERCGVADVVLVPPLPDGFSACVKDGRLAFKYSRK